MINADSLKHASKTELIEARTKLSNLLADTEDDLKIIDAELDSRSSESYNYTNKALKAFPKQTSRSEYGRNT